MTDEVRELPLTQGLVALVDADVYEWASEFKWYAWRGGNTFYAIRDVRKPDGSRAAERLHRAVLGVTDRLIQVDHINGHGLDNRRVNLRTATHAENQRNRRQQRNNSSGFRGVYWSKHDRRWRARLRLDGRTHSLGYHDTAEAAALAYDAAARELFGEYATLNFPNLAAGERGINREDIPA